MAYALTPFALEDFEKDVAAGNDRASEMRRRGWTQAQVDQARSPRATAQVQPMQGAPTPTPQADGRAPLPSAVGRIAPPGVDGRAPLPSAIGPGPTQTSTPAVAAAPTNPLEAAVSIAGQTYEGQAPDWARFQRDPAAYQAWLANQAAVANAVSDSRIAVPGGGATPTWDTTPTAAQRLKFAITPATVADLDKDVGVGNDFASELARRGWTHAEYAQAGGTLPNPAPAPPPVQAPAPAPAPAPGPNLPNPNPPPVTPQAPFTAPAGPSIPALPTPRMENGQVVTPVPQATYDWGTTITPNPMDDYARRYAQWEREYSAWQNQYGTAWQQQQQTQQTQAQAGVPTGQYDANGFDAQGRWAGQPEWDRNTWGSEVGYANPAQEQAGVPSGGYYSDASRGNPQPGMSYAQSLTPAWGQQQQGTPSAATNWEGWTSTQGGGPPGYTYRGGQWVSDAQAQQQPATQPTNSLQNLQTAQARLQGQPQAQPAPGPFTAPMGSQGTALGNQVGQANQYLQGLPPPQRVNVAALRRLPQSAQDFTTGAYEALGYDAADVNEQWQRMLPTQQQSGPRRGFVAPLGR